MLKVFISSLEKQSGKTLVAAGLAATMQSLSYSVGIFKPIQTGASELNGFKTSPDLAFIKKLDSNIITSSMYLLKGEEPPIISAYNDGISISLTSIIDDYKNTFKDTDCNIIEGSNSVTTPISPDITEIDLIKDFGCPLVLVVNPKKNNIDEVIRGIKYIQSENINFLGVVINQYNENSAESSEKYFPQMIQEICKIKVLGILPDYADINTLSAQDLISDILNKLNIEEIFSLEIAKLK